MRKINGDRWLLPQATFFNMVVLGEGELVWVDGEDLQSCFNLFVLPEAWRGYCCCSKKSHVLFLEGRHMKSAT